MAKKTVQIKLQIGAGEAKPAPPVGPVLGQHGVNIMDFCKKFNDATQEIERGMVLPVVLHVAEDKSFTFEIKSPPASVLIKKALKLPKGSSVPNKDKVGTITIPQLIEIAKMKENDLSAASLQQAVKTIAGTARSMGVIVEGDLSDPAAFEVAGEAS